MESKLKASPTAKFELQARLRCRTLPAQDVRRADIILRLSEGQDCEPLRANLRCSVNTVRLWQERFEAEELAGLYARHPSSLAAE